MKGARWNCGHGDEVVVVLSREGVYACERVHMCMMGGGRCVCVAWLLRVRGCQRV